MTPLHHSNRPALSIVMAIILAGHSAAIGTAQPFPEGPELPPTLPGFDPHIPQPGPGDLPGGFPGPEDGPVYMEEDVTLDVLPIAVIYQPPGSASDIDQFLALFSAEVKGNDDGNFADIATDYQRLFAERRLRHLALSGMRWQFSDGIALGRGRYDALVGATANKPENRTHGSIILELSRGSDGVHITQLRHAAME